MSDNNLLSTNQIELITNVLVDHLRATGADNFCEWHLVDETDCGVFVSVGYRDGERAVEQVKRLEARLKEFEAVVAESQGVAGYHRNGDIATWEELGLDQRETKDHE